MLQPLQLRHERQVELLARPIRYAYIIGADPDKKDIIKIVTSCCEAFGGTHNIIIPSNGKTLDDCWIPFLTASDPDLILLCGRFSSINAIKSQISKVDIQPFKVKTWRGEFARNERVINYSPLPIDKIYESKISEAIYQGSGTKLKVVVAPRRGKDVDLIDYFNFGILSTSFKSGFKQFVDFTSCNRLPASLTGPILYPTEACLENITHAEWEYFGSCYKEGILGPYVAITGDINSIEDCCLFWNWRALSGRPFFTRWVNPADLNDIYQGDIINQSVLDLPPSAKLLTSYSMGPSNSSSASELLSSIPNYNQKAAQIGFSYRHPSEYDKSPASARYFCLRDSISIFGESPLVINRLIAPPFNYQDCLFKDLVFDLEVKGRTPSDKSGIEVSPRHLVEDVLTLEGEVPISDVRISRTYFTVLLPCSMSTATLSVSFKSDWEIISNFCKRKGIDIADSPSGKHIRRSIELAEGIENLASFYRNNIAREMLNAFLTPHTTKVTLKGRSRELYRRSFSAMDLRNAVLRTIAITSSYKRKKAEKEINRLIDLWLRKGILVSGFELKCQECNFQTWYPIDVVGDKYVCWRCQLENKRPYDSQIQYRLQESIYQAHWENMIVPILTLDLIKSHIAEDSFLYTVPVSLEPNNPISSDIDIISVVDGEFIIAECKQPNKLDNAVFKRYGDIAKKIMAHRIVFSTISRKNTCENQHCTECEKLGEDFSDEIFTHGIPDNPKQWGTREKIKDFRQKMAQEGIAVSTFCARDLGLVTI